MIESTDAALATPRPRTQLVTVGQAAAFLGVHRETIRRRLVAGQLDGIREQRAQGAVWRVRLPVGAGAQAARAGRAAPHAASHQETDAAAAQDAQAAPAPADLGPVVAQLAGVVARLNDGFARLTEQLEAARADADRRAGEVADLRKQRGRLAAELERAASAAVATEAALAAQERRARLLALALVAVAALALVGGALAIAGWAW